MTVAAHRFNNSLRYRDAHDPAQTALTPAYVVEPLRELLGGIDLDPCTTPDNPICALRFYSPPQDGLALPWDARSIFVNPPYGRAREPWARRCVEAGKEGRQVVLLIPAHPDTRIFAEIVPTAVSVLFLSGRLKFEVLRPNRRRAAASHPSMLLGWNVDLAAAGISGVTLYRPTRSAA